MTQNDYTNWLSDEDYQSTVMEFKREAGKLLSSTFNIYGLGDYIPAVTGGLVYLAEQFGKRVRGRDVPIKTRGRM